MQKMVSIVLPVYNGERFLAESIESILNQTYKNIELIIVNDCSTDLSEDIILDYKAKDHRIIYIKNQVNLKLPQTLNNGFAIAKGEYYTWTSDDNMYHSDAIEKMVSFLELNTELGLVSCDMNMILEDGQYYKSFRSGECGKLIILNNIGACFLYRASVAKEIGEYRTDLFLIEDYEYWLRIYFSYSIGYYHETLYEYRVHSNSLSETRQAEVQKILGEFQWHNLIKYEKAKINNDDLFDFYQYVLRYIPKDVNKTANQLQFLARHPAYVGRLLKRVKSKIFRISRIKKAK